MPYAPKLQTRGSSVRNEDAKELIVACVSTFAVCSMDLFCSLSGGSCEKGADSSRSNRSPARAASIERRKKENVQSKLSDIGCRMSDVESPILYFGSQISDLGCWMSDFESRMWDVGHQFSGVNCRMFNLGCRISDVQSRMTDGNYKRP